jgi:putative restriction endonuclease
MGNMFVGLTDYDWYCNLKSENFDEVNFWRPGSTAFKALNPNDLFLFKLKKPYYAIVGGGFFVKYSLLPISLAWEAFGRKNGTKNYTEFSERLRKYREKNRIDISYPYVGCIILTEPFFFEQEDWITQPDDWPASVVVGKNMDTEKGEGKRLFQEICERLQRNSVFSQITISDTKERYQHSLVKHRLGQGAFRVLVTDTYHRRCAISGEKTLPVLEAAHIKPYSENGPHHIQNGVLLRSDIHKLFDEGYLTIAPDFRVEVSKRLKEDFGNGRIYYQYHGQRLCVIPNKADELPARDFLSWHNENIYLG